MIPTDNEKSRLTLFSIPQVAGSAMIGGPVAGGWLLARNFSALEIPDGAKTTVIISVVGTWVLATLALVIPTDFPDGILPAISGVAYAFVAQRLFGDKFKHHLEAGGTKASFWTATGITLAALPISLGLFFLVIFITPVLPLNHIKVSSNVVYYEGAAGSADAEKLGEFLIDYGYIEEDSELEFTLRFPRNDQTKVVIASPLSIPESDAELRSGLEDLRSRANRLLYPEKKLVFVVENQFGFTILRITDRQSPPNIPLEDDG